MKWLKLLTILLLVTLLTGCLYPDSQLAKNQVPKQVQLSSIQTAVDEFRNQENGLLPIKTKPQNTPVFQKYLINFSKLKEKNLVGELPATSFENGGHYQYVLINPEENPTVKLLDLRTTEALRSLQLKVKIYREKNQYPPFGEQIASGVYSLNYQKIGLEKAPTVDSPFSQQMLPVYLDSQGQLMIDYRKDLYNYMRNKKHSYQSGEDIRYLLTDHTPFVPAYSKPYTIKDGEPIFMSEYKPEE